MTIRDCPKCGGNHFGSYSCPMEDPPGTHAPKIAASPPAPSVGDVVREWDSTEFRRRARPLDLMRLGDRMAAVLTLAEGRVEAGLRHEAELQTRLTAQAKTIEGLEAEITRLKAYDPATAQEYDLKKLWALTEPIERLEAMRGSDAMGHGRNIESNNFLARADGGLVAVCHSAKVAEQLVTWLCACKEVQRFLVAFDRTATKYRESQATIAAQAAEVERLTGEVGRLARKCQDRSEIVSERDALNAECSLLEHRATTAESSLETARGALVKIEGDMIDMDEAILIAREALAALPSPPITKIKGEG